MRQDRKKTAGPTEQKLSHFFVLRMYFQNTGVNRHIRAHNTDDLISKIDNKVLEEMRSLVPESQVKISLDVERLDSTRGRRKTVSSTLHITGDLPPSKSLGQNALNSIDGLFH